MDKSSKLAIVFLCSASGCKNTHTLVASGCISVVAATQWLHVFSWQFSAHILQFQDVRQSCTNRDNHWWSFDRFIRNWPKFAECMSSFIGERGYSEKTMLSVMNIYFTLANRRFIPVMWVEEWINIQGDLPVGFFFPRLCLKRTCVWGI